MPAHDVGHDTNIFVDVTTRMPICHHVAVAYHRFDRWEFTSRTTGRRPLPPRHHAACLLLPGGAEPTSYDVVADTYRTHTPPHRYHTVHDRRSFNDHDTIPITVAHHVTEQRLFFFVPFFFFFWGQRCAFFFFFYFVIPVHHDCRLSLLPSSSSPREVHAHPPTPSPPSDRPRPTTTCSGRIGRYVGGGGGTGSTTTVVAGVGEEVL